MLLAVTRVVRLLGWSVLLFGAIYAASVVGVQIRPLIGALGLGGVAVALALEPVRAAVITAVHVALSEAGIQIPFPQRDVHMPSSTRG